MGLIRSRAGKRRDRAEAAVLAERARRMRGARRSAARERVTAGLEGRAAHPAHWWREPTVAALLGRRRARRRRW